jgi:hypothetical protein
MSTGDLLEVEVEDGCVMYAWRDEVNLFRHTIIVQMRRHGDKEWIPYDIFVRGNTCQKHGQYHGAGCGGCAEDEHGDVFDPSALLH